MNKLNVGACLILGGLWLGLGGCNDIDFSMVIIGNIAPDEKCVWEVPSDEFEYFGSGLMDLGHPIYDGTTIEPSYIMVPLLHNYLMPDLDSDWQKINSRSILIQGAQLRYSWARGADLIYNDLTETQDLRDLAESEVSIPIAVVLGSADDSGEPGKALATIELLTDYQGSQLRALSTYETSPVSLDQIVLNVEIRMVGETLGGTRVESLPFNYPIYFCYGCLTAICPDGITHPGCYIAQDFVDFDICEEE